MRRGALCCVPCKVRPVGSSRRGWGQVGRRIVNHRETALRPLGASNRSGYRLLRAILTGRRRSIRGGRNYNKSVAVAQVMTSRELVIRTLNHQPVDRVPRDLWVAPAVETGLADDLAEVNLRYPSDIVAAEFAYPPGKRAAAKLQRDGVLVDAWGCAWQVTARGPSVIVGDPPLAQSGKVDGFVPPAEVLEPARYQKVDRACQTTARFVLARTDVRPFDRLRALRGAQRAVVELARGGKEVRKLLDVIHQHNCQQIKLWAGVEVDGVEIRDDWGSQEGLLLPPALWRQLFRPLYAEYCRILHEHDKFVFFHTAGDVSDIFGDLVKIGCDAIHTDWSAVKFDRLVQRYRGSVTFWGGIHSVQMLTSGTPDQVREAAQKVRQALDTGHGGVIAQCPWEPDMPLKNIMAVFEKWSGPLPRGETRAQK